MSSDRPRASRWSPSSMDYSPHDQAFPRRKPLSDATTRINNVQSSTPIRGSSPCPSSSPRIPHHASRKPGGNLQVRNNPSSPLSPASNAENKRLSAIASEGQTNSNRNSQYSTTSTNASGKSKRKTHVGPWNLGPTIGKGATGRVRKAKHALTGQFAAVKIVSKRSAALVQSTSLAGMDTMANGKNRMPRGIEREVVIMKLIEHPNVMNLYDVWENRGELYLVLEYIEGGELFGYITSRGRLPEHEAVRIFRQIMAGLSYCHRFNICHRDLKPENILLDSNCNVKLADFGMAALQPAGKWLVTSCGSPHYASPEVINGIRYRGDKADIWSCGVILFAMLTGRLPFGGEENESVNSVLRAVRSARYSFPDGLSREAKDLIWRILQPDPKDRMAMEAMWQHPLIRKYEHLDHDYGADSERWIGPAPPLTPNDCGPPIRKRADLDRELLRNLRTLWHGVQEEVLVERLLSEEPNHEKVFYTALTRFREEQLENYQGPPIEYSASDYHHVHQPIRHSSSRVHSKATGHDRRRSQFSILSDNVVRSSQSYHRNPSVADTEESYDPFRPSRTPIFDPRAEHAHVTVLRGASKTSRRSRAPSNAASVRHPALARLQRDDVFSIPSSPPSLPYNSNTQTGKLRKDSSNSRYSSRTSLASSYRQRSSSAGVRKSASYRRGVSFINLRKRSGHNPLPPVAIEQLPSLPSLDQNYVDEEPQRESAGARTTTDSSPRAAPTVVRSRKKIAGTTFAQELAEKKARIASLYWKDDARKVSTELEKFCDEAFKDRYSAASSTPTAVTVTTDPHEVSYESPATSLSVREDSGTSSTVTHHTSAVKGKEGDAYRQRPLPAPPSSRELVGSYTQRELTKARDLLIQRAADTTAGFTPGYLDDVIAHLDRLMQPSTSKIHEQDSSRRVASAPDQKSPDTFGYLPRINEERLVFGNDGDEFERLIARGHQGYRAVSEPMATRIIPADGKPLSRTFNTNERTSIRVVDYEGHEPISPVRPLVIRKRSGASTSPVESLQHQPGMDRSREIEAKSSIKFEHDASKVHYRRPQSEERRSTGYSIHESTLPPIEEDEKREQRDSKTAAGDGKKRGWFRRHNRQTTQNSQGSVERGPTPPVKDEWPLQNHQEQTSNARAKLRNRVSDTSSEEFQQRPEPRKDGRGLFSKLFSKRDSKEKKDISDLALGGNDLDDDAASIITEDHRYQMSGALNASTTSVATRHTKNDRDSRTSNEPLHTTMRSIQPQHQNWLLRFLHIKPATKVLCFQVSKFKARKEIVSLLREWRKYGMRDVVVDKVAGRVWARVAEKNTLAIKPVSLACELFTLLSHGRKANLALARFSQEKGAKSSFEKVVGTLEVVLRRRGVLVEDRGVWGEMERVLG